MRVPGRPLLISKPNVLGQGQIENFDLALHVTPIACNC